MAYSPTYTWPNDAFPFRVYFESDRLRIFIIENIQHNWLWLNQYADKIKSTDVFLVYCGWYHSEYFANQAEAIFDELKLDKKRFYFLFNHSLELDNFSKKGFVGEVINQNCWLDENLVMKPLDIEKRYDAIYVGRFSAFKRHYLADGVDNLALVAGNNHGNAVADIPSHKFLNDGPLNPDEVCIKINESKCGLILSKEEGACFASSEYLLCGVPVVSTQELGGRSVWYNEYNSIIVSDDVNEVKEAVQFFVDNPRNPELIRSKHLALSGVFRAKFVLKLAEIFYEYDVVGVDASKYFRENFIHKLRKSYKPDFEKIFGEEL